MRVRVRLDANCRFDIGERTPETRALVKQYVKALMTYAAEHGGQPPGSYRLAGKSPAWAWSDANWEINYTVTRSGGTVTISIYAVRLHSSGGGS
jgi:hypothetical protein